MTTVSLDTKIYSSDHVTNSSSNEFSISVCFQNIKCTCLQIVDDGRWRNKNTLPFTYSFWKAFPETPFDFLVTFLSQNKFARKKLCSVVS